MSELQLRPSLQHLWLLLQLPPYLYIHSRRGRCRQINTQHAQVSVTVTVFLFDAIRFTVRFSYPLGYDLILIAIASISIHYFIFSFLLFYIQFVPHMVALANNRFHNVNQVNASLLVYFFFFFLKIT